VAAMNYLPIVDRELRVAARRPGTWWWRLLVALIGIVVVETSLSNRYMGSPRGLSPGPQLFQALSALALVYALLAGLVYTADCISEERREGTLGLLFLTPLRGMDVVLGKLVATSLPGVYAMAAILPLFLHRQRRRVYFLGSTQLIELARGARFVAPIAPPASGIGIYCRELIHRLCHGYWQYIGTAGGDLRNLSGFRQSLI
jgi:ABC-type transport system involved in cytochrome c biogenesis permease component